MSGVLIESLISPWPVSLKGEIGGSSVSVAIINKEDRAILVGHTRSFGVIAMVAMVEAVRISKVIIFN